MDNVQRLVVGVNGLGHLARFQEGVGLVLPFQTVRGVRGDALFIYHVQNFVLLGENREGPTVRAGKGKASITSEKTQTKKNVPYLHFHVLGQNSIDLVDRIHSSHVKGPSVVVVLLSVKTSYRIES